MNRIPKHSRRALMIVATIAALAACAPDAVTNREATGFNAYINQIASACKPLMVGSYDMTPFPGSRQSPD